MHACGKWLYNLKRDDSMILMSESTKIIGNLVEESPELSKQIDGA